MNVSIIAVKSFILFFHLQKFLNVEHLMLTRNHYSNESFTALNIFFEGR